MAVEPITSPTEPMMTGQVSDEEDSTQIEQTIDESMAVEPITPSTEPMMTSQLSDEEDSTQFERTIDESMDVEPITPPTEPMMTSQLSDEEDSTQFERNSDEPLAVEPITPQTEPMMASQLSDEEDSTQIEQKIKALFAILDNQITNLEGKLTDAKSSKENIEALLGKAIPLLNDEVKIKEEDSADKWFRKRDVMVAPSNLTGNNTDFQQIQILDRKLDHYMAKVDQELHLLEKISSREEINRDREEATTLKLTLEICDTRNDLEVGSLVAYTNQWLNDQKTQSIERGDKKGNSFSVLVVHDSRDLRETRQRLLVLLGYQKKLQMDVSVAKNGKEAVYLHLAGASFDMIIMDDRMPFMDGIEATKLLRRMGVDSHIVGVTREFKRLAFMDSGADSCIIKPLTLGKLTAVFP
ncbi:hypothetical protein DKX38_000349 [Salix brachista]|uniref:Response regulatory domain-containing protein n=1 Tax=Salix brachista TaxID=2182728 RepID=A0A5N5P0L6_9ROSI|nr:hypothetical protein DKX38_000349 [Salix brachista]